MKKFLKGVIKKSQNDYDIYEAIVSTKTADRDGEEISQEAWELENFKKNPVLLFSHNYTQPPVGKFIDIYPSEKGLLGKFKFATTKMAQELKQLVKEDILNALSVGFMKKEYSDEAGNTISKQELLEVSLVSVPANPEALIIARSKGLNVDLLEVNTKSLSLGYKDLDRRIKQLEDLQAKSAVKKPVVKSEKKADKPEVSEKEILRKALAKVATGLSGCLYDLKKGKQ